MGETCLSLFQGGDMRTLYLSTPAKDKLGKSEPIGQVMGTCNLLTLDSGYYWKFGLSSAWVSLQCFCLELDVLEKFGFIGLGIWALYLSVHRGL